MRLDYAQTNLQLYAQLRQARYVAEDMRGVRDAYELALVLFTGCYRASGKPFLAHLVGTASILASIRARGPVVAAGLLHAAYSRGQFENGWSGRTPERRERVREVVGPEVEDLVMRYTALRWQADTIPQIHDGLESRDPREREVLLMRLANELEDHLDLGVLYCADADRRREHLTSSLYLCVDMAKRLGVPELADALAQAFSDVNGSEVPPTFRRAESGSFVLAPASYGLRAGVRLRRLMARLQGR